ncbi:unnamed protein product [Euphydryas editha]|uniref:Uncharacterized protein n=1 Tax=Euphydryas editha TaxID=104508 RepID=A0AAU9UVF6_EUPED|nr:unnamed protein product [Euphydryas editha]
MNDAMAQLYYNHLTTLTGMISVVRSGESTRVRASGVCFRACDPDSGAEVRDLVELITRAQSMDFGTVGVLKRRARSWPDGRLLGMANPSLCEATYCGLLGLQ